MKLTIISGLIGLVLASSLHAGLQLYPEYHYVFTPIPSAFGVSDLEPTGINNNNQVVGVGFSSPSGASRAFVSYGGHTQIIDYFAPYPYSWGMGINDAGRMIGAGTTANGERIFYKDLNGSIVDEGGSSSTDTSTGRSINNDGYFVGQLNNQAALGSTSGNWIIQVNQVLGNSFLPYSISDDMKVVGTGPAGGAVWDIGTGSVTQLSSVLGTASNAATAINKNGAVAGTVGHVGYIFENGLVKYFGANIASVSAINSSDNIVGYLTTGHAFLYTASSNTVTDLNTLANAGIPSKWTLKTATALNDKNSICGLAYRPATAKDGNLNEGGYVYEGYTLIISSIFVVNNPLGGLLNDLK